MTRSPVDHDSDNVSLELSLLQLLRLKGRAAAAVLAAGLGRHEDAVAGALAQAVGAGYCTAAGSAFRLSPAGKQRLAELLADEREGVDQERLEGLYEEFDGSNSELKNVVSAWQMKDENTPNDHADAGYDASVLQRLQVLHDGFTGLLERIVAEAPRLGHYPARFAAALAKALAGEQKFVASPIADSYHQVWFELHEELIGLLGRTRAEEAAAGRAV